MVKFIYGVKGSGKTKKMIEMANEAAKSSNGAVVYIYRDRNHMYEVDRSIRYIESGEFQMDSLKAFYGFVCGVLSQNFDIEKIFIDGQKLVTNAPDECLQNFIKNLNLLCEKFNADFFVSISRDIDQIPEFLKEHLA